MTRGKSPDFCLLIPCYNNFPGLIESLKSVNYAPDRCVMVIVDDGSHTPITPESIQEEVSAMEIVVLRSEKNQGITRALNKGLEWIEHNVNCKYVARLDCGDINLPERFTIQVNYLDAHSDVGLLGSWCRFVDESSSLSYTYKSSIDHIDIIRELYFRNVFMHATVMFRTELLKQTGYYPLEYDYVEDYALFWKLSEVAKTCILDHVLVICKVNRQGISFRNKRKQLAARWKVVRTFSKSSLRRVAAFFWIQMLFIIPKELNLRLKRLRG